jgi:hypothetical protein
MKNVHVGTGVLARLAERSSAVARGRLQSAAGVLLSALREIFDESAYHRFLNRTQMSPSTQAYAAFRKELEALKARRPKCC